jgi:septum formation protein
MLAFEFIWLASQSPRRRELLGRLGVRAELLVADASIDIAEDVEALEHPLEGENPTQYVERVVAAKLTAAMARHQRRRLEAAPILVADTTVAIGGRILGKPAHAAEAVEMLSALSGRSHRVLTAMAIARPRIRSKLSAPPVPSVPSVPSEPTEPSDGGMESPWHPKILRVTSLSRVRFARLSRAQIDRYVATGEPMDKAGAYAVQGGAGAFIRRIDGSDTGIMGLPLYEASRLLQSAGALPR